MSSSLTRSTVVETVQSLACAHHSHLLQKNKTSPKEHSHPLIPSCQSWSFHALTSWWCLLYWPLTRVVPLSSDLRTWPLFFVWKSLLSIAKLQSDVPDFGCALFKQVSPFLWWWHQSLELMCPSSGCCIASHEQDVFPGRTLGKSSLPLPSEPLTALLHAQTLESPGGCCRVWGLYWLSFAFCPSPSAIRETECAQCLGCELFQTWVAPNSVCFEFLWFLLA